MAGRALEQDDWLRLNSRLLWIYDEAVPETGSRKFSSPNYSAWLVRRGHVKVSWPGHEPIVIGGGSWVIPPLNVERSQLFSRDAAILSMCFQLEWPNYSPLFPLKKLVSFRSSSAPELEKHALDLLNVSGGRLTFPWWREDGFMDFGKHSASQAKFWQWLARWSSVMIKNGVEPFIPDKMDSRVAGAIKMIDGLSFTGKIPYGNLEKIAGLGKVQIDRLFLKNIGMTPRKYLERRVLESARELLQTTGMSVKEIGFKLGFASASHFCFWFRKRAGIYPLDFKLKGWPF